LKQKNAKDTDTTAWNFFLEVREILFRHNIKISYENVYSSKNRFIMTALKMKNRGVKPPTDGNRKRFPEECSPEFLGIVGEIMKNVNEFNGLVCEMRTWKPLVIPIPHFNTKCDNAYVNKMLKKGEYNVYKIQDGTVVNFYYWKNNSEIRKKEQKEQKPIEEKKSETPKIKSYSDVAKTYKKVVKEKKVIDDENKEEKEKQEEKQEKQEKQEEEKEKKEENEEKQEKKADKKEENQSFLKENSEVHNVDSIENWKISTNHGYDVSNVKWKTKTYKTIIKEVLEKLGKDETSFYNSLDKEYSYSFVFKHPDFQPYQENTNKDVYKFIFIQRSKFEDNKVIYEDKIPVGTHFNEQEKVNVSDIRILFKNLPSALSDAIDGKDVNYGYILRAKNLDIRNYQHHLLLESTLQRSLRSIIYDKIRSPNITNKIYDRDTYILINSYLNQVTSNTYVRLFPQHKTKFDLLDKIGDMIVDKIFAKTNKQSAASAPLEGEVAKKDDHLYEGIKLTNETNAIIDELYKNLNNVISLTYNKDIKEMIRKTIASYEHLDLFYDIYMIQ
jgi:hypothetical protein